jgi:uncharacterized protein
MKKIYILLLITIATVTSVSSQECIVDYSAVDGFSGQYLKSELHKLIKHSIIIRLRSKKGWDVYKESDRDSLIPGNIILFYSGESVNADQKKDNKRIWEREHVWAQAHGKLINYPMPFNDLHNLKPCDKDFNKKKRDKDFDCDGESSKRNNDGCISYYDKDSWEPCDKVKGDVARIIFYMAVRYEGDDCNPYLELKDSVNTSKKNIPEGKGYYGKLSTLLEWNKSDPVDIFERNRNNVICRYQGNRNPFIDHPEYADLIWNSAGLK